MFNLISKTLPDPDDDEPKSDPDLTVYVTNGENSDSSNFIRGVEQK